MRAKFFLILLFTGLVFKTGIGQDTLTLSLEAARLHALEFNKNIENAEMAVLQARKKLFETIAAGLPQAEATMDYSNFMGAEMEISFAEGVPPQRIPFNPTSNLNVTVSQLIFSGSYIVGVQSARLYRQMSETSRLKTEQEIKDLVTRLYINSLMANQTIDILSESLENTSNIFEKTKVMVSVGIVEKIDIDQFEVQKNTIVNNLRSAERQKEVAYNLLRFQLGVDINTPLNLTDSLPGLIHTVEFATLLADTFSLENNLDYRLMQTQEELTKKQITLQKMNYLPTLAGFYNYTRKILKPELDFSPNNVIGLNMSIPIFSSGMRNAKVSQAQIQYKTALNNKQLLTEQLFLQQKQAKYNLASAMEQYENMKRNVEVAYRVYKNHELKYKQGVFSSLDLITSYNNYLQAESAYIMAINSVFDAQLALQKLMNTL
ncbi:MAG: TolC family protein [Bacteroidales bacterium]|nr:TolC family protein [Bacteroidales bacterium]